MLQPWRIKLRQAEQALRQGQLEEATRLVCLGNLREFLPAKQLLARIAAGYAERGQSRAACGETMAGWRDLEDAARLGSETPAVAALRRQLVETGISEAEGYLAAGDPEAAVARLDTLARRHAATGEIRRLRQAAEKLLAAKRLTRQARFAEALPLYEAAALLQPQLSFVEGLREQCRSNVEQSGLLAEKLHQSVAAVDWTTALHLADEWLQLAPECLPALDARRRAWAAVGAAPIDGRLQICPTAGRREQPAAGPRPERKRDMDQASDVMLAGEPAPRFFLWIDGVGGYLVCEGDEYILGQPVGGGRVDIPLLGDVSRQHATIRRDGEGYLLAPRRATRLNSHEVQGITLLTDGSLLELGEGVRLRFRRPHPLSASARLEFASRHRTQPAADAVLLLADSLVLGPGENSHVVCRGWTRELVLYRQGTALYCRCGGRFTVDGVPCEGVAPITRSSQIAGDDFSLSLEGMA